MFPNAGNEPYPAKSNLNFEPAPVKSTVPDPVKLNPAIDVVEPPNEIASVPKVIDEFANVELGIEPNDNSILLLSMAVDIGELPTISKLSPKFTSKVCRCIITYYNLTIYKFIICNTAS